MINYYVLYVKTYTTTCSILFIVLNTVVFFVHLICCHCHCHHHCHCYRHHHHYHHRQWYVVVIVIVVVWIDDCHDVLLLLLVVVVVVVVRIDHHFVVVVVRIDHHFVVVVVVVVVSVGAQNMCALFVYMSVFVTSLSLKTCIKIYFTVVCSEWRFQQGPRGSHLLHTVKAWVGCSSSPHDPPQG